MLVVEGVVVFPNSLYHSLNSIFCKLSGNDQGENRERRESFRVIIIVSVVVSSSCLFPSGDASAAQAQEMSN